MTFDSCESSFTEQTGHLITTINESQTAEDTPTEDQSALSSAKKPKKKKAKQEPEQPAPTGKGRAKKKKGPKIEANPEVKVQDQSLAEATEEKCSSPSTMDTLKAE